MGNFEKLGVLVIIILAVVIMIILIGGPGEGLEPDPEEPATRLESDAPREPGAGSGGPRAPGTNHLEVDPDLRNRFPPPPVDPDPVDRPDEPGRGPGLQDPPAEPDPVVEDLFHVVQKNESLYSIAKRYYGHGKYYRAIREANPTVNPSLMATNTRLVIPHPDKVLGASSSRSPAVETPVPEPGNYTVVKGDSLWKIAEKTLGRGSEYRRIQAANREKLGPDGTHLAIGMVLRIPK